MSRRFPCLNCLSEIDSVTLLVDRKGRPYTTCALCGTRSFMRSPEGLRGLKVFAPQIREVLAQIAQTGGMASLDATAEPLLREARASRGTR